MESKNQAALHGLGIIDQKRELRRTCRHIREGLGEAARYQASLLICDWIESWSDFQNSSVILAYMPITGEVDLTSLIHRKPQKQWVLPRIIPKENHRMVFHPYEANHLVHHPFGMDEPSAGLPIISSDDIQLALVPGMAFDRLGRRLGYGGGYFDRFLADFSGTSLGVIFQALLLETLPCGDNDIPVQWIVTERGLFSTKPPE